MKNIHLSKANTSIFRELIQLFGQVFEDVKTYNNLVLTDEYLEKFLGNEKHIVVVAQNDNNTIVGGLVAYELDKFEKNRKEFYIYDLAVLESYQRLGIGTTLVQELFKIAKQRNVHVVFVQADAEDQHAIAFYKKLFGRELVAHHFELEI